MSVARIARYGQGGTSGAAIARALALAAVAMLLGGSTRATGAAEAKPGAPDLAAARTYVWGAREAKAVRNKERLPLEAWQNRFRRAVDGELQARALSEVKEGAADVTVTDALEVEEREQEFRERPGESRGGARSYRSREVRYALELRDAAGKAVLWKTKLSQSEEGESPEKIEEETRRQVAKAFRKHPVPPAAHGAR